MDTGNLINLIAAAASLVGAVGSITTPLINAWFSVRNAEKADHIHGLIVDLTEQEAARHDS